MKLTRLLLALTFSGATFTTAADTRVFTVINQSNSPVYVAQGRFSSAGHTSSLNSFSPEQWSARGWTKVPPGARKDITRGGGEYMYIRMIRNGKEIKPRRSYSTAHLCISTTSRFQFNMIKRDDGSWDNILVQGSKGRRTSSTCTGAGGTLAVFWKVKTHTDFTVRN